MHQLIFGVLVDALPPAAISCPPVRGGRFAPAPIGVGDTKTQPSPPTQPGDSDARRQKDLPNTEARAPSKARGRSRGVACVFV